MNVRTLSLIAGTLSSVALLTAQSFADDAPPPDPTPKGVEVQARGPIHEAYAQPSDTRPLPSVIVAKQPPAALGRTAAGSETGRR